MAMKTVKNRLLKQINNTYGSFYGGNYDSEEELPDYDERMQADVEYDIATNANSVEFDEDGVAADTEVVQGEVVEDAASDIPDFMKAE